MIPDEEKNVTITQTSREDSYNMYEHSMQWNVVSWRIAHVASRISKVNYTLDLHMSECYNTGRC